MTIGITIAQGLRPATPDAIGDRAAIEIGLRSRGVTELRCDVLHRNHALLGVLRRTVGPTTVRSAGLVLHASVRLLAAPAPLPWRAP